MFWHCLRLKKKKHLSIRAWVRVMLVSVVNIIHWYYLFLTCDISLGYIEKQRNGKKKIFFLEKNLNKTNAPVIWCLSWSLADVATRLSARVDALHLALRIEGIFLLQNVRTQREEEKGTSYDGTASFYQNVSKKEKKKIKNYKVYFCKCKYPHLQELECWSYLLSRHGILLYVIYMQFIILWLSLFCICVR